MVEGRSKRDGNIVPVSFYIRAVAVFFIKLSGTVTYYPLSLFFIIYAFKRILNIRANSKT